jgi:hypothetical protein
MKIRTCTVCRLQKVSRTSFRLVLDPEVARLAEFEVRQKYHTSVALELVRLARGAEYEAVVSWVDVDGVCHDSVGGWTVIVGS